MTGLTIALAGYAAGASAADPSAVLQQPKGQVFVGQAATMTPAQHNMPLYPGNRVVVAAGGRVTVVYTDGCTVTLPEKSLLAVGGPSQCKNGRAVAHTTGSFQNARIGQAGTPPSGGAGAGGTGGAAAGGAGAGGTGGAAAGGAAAGGAAGATIAGVSTGIVVAGVAGVGLVATAISTTNSNQNPPASPQ